MANQIQHTYGTAAPASDALAKSEIAVRHIAANCTASSSSMLYVGEDAADDGVTARALGTGISGDSGQGGAAIGGNITFTGGTDITTSVSGSTVTITSSAGGGSGDMTGVDITADTGLDISQSNTTSGNYTSTISLDLSELSDGTADIDSNDEVIYLDNGTEKRKAFSELKLSEFNNDSGWTSNSGDITGVTAGDGLTGGGSSGSVTLTLGVDDSTIEISSDAARVKASGITTSHLAADAVTGAKIADDAIDSEHYTNASIDHAHLSNDCIDGDNIQNDVINSEHYAAASIDEEHLNATNSPSDNQILSYDSSSGGFTWVDDQTGGGGGSGTTINNNANNYIITGSGTADTLEAESTFTFDAGALVLSERSPTITMGTSHPSAAPQIKMYEGTTLKSGSSTNITVATEWAYDAMSGAVMAIGSTEYDFAGGVYMGAV